MREMSDLSTDYRVMSGVCRLVDKLNSKLRIASSRGIRVEFTLDTYKSDYRPSTSIVPQIIGTLGVKE